MKGTFQLAIVAGIPIKVHWSFGLLLLYVSYVAFTQGSDVANSLIYIALFVIVFLCVVLHEYGHALMARRFGVSTRDIILSPIGGIARLEFIPDKPYQEILIAIAGPAVNFVIAAVLILAESLSPQGQDLTSPGFLRLNLSQVMILVAQINVILLVFNMIPAFPMDGGRVLRALLAIPFDRVRATVIASFLGQLIGLVFICAGLYELIFREPIYIGGVHVSSMILALIGVFVFIVAPREVRNVKLKASLASANAGQLASTEFEYVDGQSTIRESGLNIPSDGAVVVLNGGVFAGLIFKENYDYAIEHGGNDDLVIQHTSNLYEYLDAAVNLETVLELFRSKGYRACPVTQDDKVIGVLTRKTIIQFIKSK